MPELPPVRTGKQMILRWLRTGMLSSVLALALAYLADYLILRARMATGGNALGKVTVRPIYNVPQKNRSTEYLLGDPAPQDCVRSLFPHLNEWPCWYLERHKEMNIDM